MPFALPPGLDLSQDKNAKEIEKGLPSPSVTSTALPNDVTYIFILFSNRSGSTYLSELLATTNFFGLAREYFNWDAVLPFCKANGIESLKDYVFELVTRYAPNKQFVTKTSPAQLAMLARDGVLDSIIDRARFVLVERMDKVAQVVSWSIATQTRQFTSYHTSTDAGTPTFDGGALRRSLDGLIKVHAQAELFMALNGIVPCHVTYEELVENPLFVGARICEYIGYPRLRCDPSRVNLQRQTTHINSEWCKKFVSEQQALQAV